MTVSPPQRQQEMIHKVLAQAIAGKKNSKAEDPFNQSWTLELLLSVFSLEGMSAGFCGPGQ